MIGDYLKSEGWRNPAAAVAFAVLAAYVGADLLVDHGASWKTRVSYHAGFRKATIPIGAVNTDSFEIAAVVTGLVAVVVGIMHRSFDEGSLSVLAGAGIALRRMRVLPLLDELVRQQGSSYVGWERYAQDTLNNIRFMTAVLAGVMVLSLLSQMESLRVSEVRRKMTLYRMPVGVVALGLVLGVVVKGLAVDLAFPSWRAQALYYRDISTVAMPFSLGFEAAAAVAALGILYSLVATKSPMHVASLGLLAAAQAVELTFVKGLVDSLGTLKKSVQKPGREKAAAALLADARLWHAVQAGLILAAIGCQLLGDRFVRKLSDDEIAAFKKARAEKQAATKKARTEAAINGKSSSGRDGAKARERKRAMQEGMAASTTKTGKAKKEKIDGLNWGKIKSN